MNRRLSLPLHSVALDLQRRGRWAIDAGRLDEGLSILRLAVDRLATSTDVRTPVLRAELIEEIAAIEARVGVAVPPTERNPGVVSTQPGPSDLELLGDMVASRIPLEIERKKAGER